MIPTCFIRHEIDPFKRALFRQYAERWSDAVPRRGGRLVGYFLPSEGTNHEAWALVSFDGLTAYDAYRRRLKEDVDAIANLEFAQRERFIVPEQRTFTEAIDATIPREPASSGQG